jgi:hypothetical protein
MTIYYSTVESRDVQVRQNLNINFKEIYGMYVWVILNFTKQFKIIRNILQRWNLAQCIDFIQIYKLSYKVSSLKQFNSTDTMACIRTPENVFCILDYKVISCKYSYVDLMLSCMLTFFNVF